MVLAAVGVVVIAALLGPITDLIARHDVSALSQAQRAAHLQTARETARTQLLTLGAGIFAGAALLFTALNFILARQGQVTTRYTEAISQLGSDKLDVRIGGIYALERIARDSARDHPTIIEVLAAFIRQHSHEPWPPPDARSEQQKADPESEQKKRSTRPDIQAALTVIGRRDIRRELRRRSIAPIDLTGADLTGVEFFGDLSRARLVGTNFASADLTCARLIGAYLTRANLTNADLFNATLCKAHLDNAHLDSANLAYADLRESRLSNTHFTKAGFVRANLAKAYAKDADFSNASLRNTDLRGAHFDHANFDNADLEHADLRGAYFDYANFDNAKIYGAKFNRTSLRSACLMNCDFIDPEAMSRVDLTGAYWPTEYPPPEGWHHNEKLGYLVKDR